MQHDVNARAIAGARGALRPQTTAIALVAALLAASWSGTVVAQTAAPSTAEGQFLAQIDAAIAPVRDRLPSSEEAQRLRDALKAVDANEPSRFRALAAELPPHGRKLVEWHALRRGIGTAQEFAAFTAANSDWPEMDLLARRAEEQLLVGGGNARSILEFFKGREPRSGPGLAALASAYLAAGDEAKARALARKAWREHELAGTLETGFLERFQRFLDESDHKRRLDFILVDEVRLGSTRSERTVMARRLLPRLSEGERRKAEARIAAFSRARNATQLLAALPATPADRQDWGLVFQRAQLARVQDRNEDAAALLRSAPDDKDKLVDPDAWWSERRFVAYDLLRAGKAKLAYDVVKVPGPLTVNPLKDATYLAGWIALRRLKDPKAAIAHFDASRVAADGPLTAARALYWLARAHDAAGQKAEARRWYEEAAKRFDTFHGQLARFYLQPGPHPITLPLPKAPTPEAVRAFNDSDLIKAAVLAHQADAGRGLARIIVAHLRYRLKSEGEMAMLAHLADALGDRQMSLRVGKTAIARGMNLANYAYPVHPFPAYTPLRTPPEAALLLAIARQESEFNPNIVSHAGARGILQVMPITARHICRDHKITCDIPRLTKDSAYNAMIGSAYIGDRKAEFAGSYVLTLAGYNAGPARARQWVQQFGDPRKGDVDAVDWIEALPFEETREYVKKVLSNLQIYRARLGETSPLRLDVDLHRRSVAKAPTDGTARPRAAAKE